MRKLILTAVFLFSIALSSEIVSLRMFDDMQNVMSASSEHFIYTYKKELSGIAPKIAEIAEGVYDTLSELMQTKVRTKINLIITDQSDVPNGSSSPLLNPVVNIYLANPDASFIAKHSEWIEYVLTHEITHALHLSSTRPSCLSLTRNSLFYAPNGAYPMYFLEGYTVYNESTLNRGRMKDTNYEAFLRTMLIDSAVQPIGNASSYFNRDFPYSTLPYIYGPYLFDKYKEKYNSNLTRLTRLDFCSLLPFSVIFPDFFMRAKFGAYPSDVLKEVYKDIEEKTEILENSMTFSKRENVTFGGYDNTLPLYSGGNLYYIKSFPHREKRMVERFDGKERELFKVTYSTNFSLRGGKIYIDMLDIYDNTNMFFDMYEYDFNSGKIEKLELTSRGFGGDALGDTLLFIRNSGGRQRIIIYSLSKRSAVDSFAVEENFKYYSISIKNYNEILISCYREGGYTDIILYDLIERKYKFLTSDIDSDNRPQWSDYKNMFYFISDRSGVSGVYSYDLNDSTVQKIYTSIYNVSAFSVDEENEKIYVQDISKYGDDIYVSDILMQEEECVVLNEIKPHESLRKENIKFKENGRYLIPQFSGPGVYAFLPFALPVLDTLEYFFLTGMPFLNFNSDVSQALSVIFFSLPYAMLDASGMVTDFDYQTYINITSSHFKNDIGLMVTFQRDSLNNESDGASKYIPNVYQVSLASSFNNSKPFSYFSFAPSLSLEKSSYVERKGLSFSCEYDNYESSLKSITPSEGYRFYSECYFASIYRDSTEYDFGVNLNFTLYKSPMWDANFFIESNAFFSNNQYISASSGVVEMDYFSDMPNLSFNITEDGMRDKNYRRDFSYVKFGVVRPLTFINRGIPIKFMESVPVRLDYISISASQLAGYSVTDNEIDLASRASINLSINLSLISITPGIAVTYNNISDSFTIGMTATIK